MKIPSSCSVFATAGSPENGESAVVFSHFCDPGLFLEDIDIEVELLGLVEQNGPHLFFFSYRNLSKNKNRNAS